MAPTSEIGSFVHDKTKEYGLKSPGKVTFCASSSTLGYPKGDPRNDNPVRKLTSKQNYGLASQIIQAELTAMFPDASPDFQYIELSKAYPGRPEWARLAESEVILLSFLTSGIPHVLPIINRFADSKIVISGGLYPTYNARSLHDLTSDKTAIVEGRMEGMLPEVLAHAQENSHRGKSFKRPKLFRAQTDYHTLLRTGAVSKLTSVNSYGEIVEAGLGCENRCDFCLISTFALSERNIGQLKTEISRIHQQGVRYLMFADDNLSDRSPNLLAEVFTHVNNLGMGWIGEGTRKILDNPSVAKIVGKNNISFLHGIEDDALRGHTVDKHRSLEQIQDDVKAFLDYGFMVIGSSVLGLDTHSFPDTFLSYRDNIYSLRIPVALHIATPNPGSAFYRNMKKQGRIFDSDPASYNNGTLVFTPAKMDDSQMMHGYRWLQRELGSPEHCLKVMDYVSKRVGPDKFIRLPRAGLVLGGVLFDHMFNGSQFNTPDALSPFSVSLLNKGRDFLKKNV